MITDIESLLYQAEDAYLSDQDLAVFKTLIFSLETRLKLYNNISSQEIEIFQYIANRLVSDFPDEDEKKLGQALQHWLLVIRHCAMAMLLDNQKYLQHRILEWLPEQISVYNLTAIEEKLFTYLHKRYQKKLNTENFALLEPYLHQAQSALLNSN